jgi:trimethylamine---corrinoid protein Co-methyltransferase
MERLKFLSDADIQAMHEATLHVLSEVGIIWTRKPSLEILTEAGYMVKQNRVCFPPHLVMDSIEKAGKRLCIRERNGQVNKLGAGNLYFHNLGGARDVFDARTGTRQIATEQDVIDSTRLLDALPNAHTVTPFFTPRDVPGELMSLLMYRHTLPHTTKPVQGPGIQNAEEVKYAKEM